MDAVNQIKKHGGVNIKFMAIIAAPEGLERFDASDIHKDWKSKYGDLLESKAIFDCD